MELKRKLEWIPRGENYEKLRSLSPNPPFCSLNYKIKRPSPFIVLDVKVRNGLKGKLALYDGDKAEQKSKEFAIAF